ncbi:MAG TPA: pantoate--beta-alanine ligase [Sandaracinaceae bacterium LLY-WYZ-13_1]|nr:pantoate--beta-alanine ligase [Sandaracinaceae bacterium LLY-WYZ-13_1]
MTSDGPSPRVVHERAAFRAACDEARAAGRRVGLVPTMGALHAGHLSLVAEARRRGADHVALTVFVNPLQFGPDEDFDRYPRSLDDDLARCREAGVDTVFAPARDRMYPAGFSTRVEVDGITEPLEGRFRPGHFDGVTTVVAKLFALTGPSVAVFGRKDYQQLKTIERMGRDLDLPVEVVGAPIVREPDGLALSSRNRYLSAEERARALGLVTGLRAAWDAFDGGERRAERLLPLAREPVDARFDRIDYVALADADDLRPLEGALPERCLLAVAAHLGATRLIDNVVLGEDRRPGGPESTSPSGD